MLHSETENWPEAQRRLRMADYTYELPEGRVAQHPLADRAAARLLVARGGAVSHTLVRDLPELLEPGTLCVMNDTRVMSARLHMQRATGGTVEIFCLAPLPTTLGLDFQQALQLQGRCSWQCLVGGGKRWRSGETVSLKHPDVVVHAMRGQTTDAGSEVYFTWLPASLTWGEVLLLVGHVPLPPYLNRPDEPTDAEAYQTVYARHLGAVAAPTAGLHFTPELLAVLQERGVDLRRVTLHVGAGTFLPVTAAHAAEHRLHSELVHVAQDTLAALAEAPHTVMAVGTTSLRTLESLYWLGAARLAGFWRDELPPGQWFPAAFPYTFQGESPTRAVAMATLLEYMHDTGQQTLSGQTALYIMPGYRTQMVDILMTNFHQPGSTLLLLVAAFMGDGWREVYAQALQENYRFLSYGDASLLWKSGI